MISLSSADDEDDFEGFLKRDSRDNLPKFPVPTPLTPVIAAPHSQRQPQPKSATHSVLNVSSAYNHKEKEAWKRDVMEVIGPALHSITTAGGFIGKGSILCLLLVVCIMMAWVFHEVTHLQVVFSKTERPHLPSSHPILPRQLSGTGDDPAPPHYEKSASWTPGTAHPHPPQPINGTLLRSTPPALVFRFSHAETLGRRYPIPGVTLQLGRWDVSAVIQVSVCCRKGKYVTRCSSSASLADDAVHVYASFDSFDPFGTCTLSVFFDDSDAE